MAPVRLHWGHYDFSVPHAFVFDSCPIVNDRFSNAPATRWLGVHVRNAISNELAGLGLGHVPVELPGYQDDLVRLFKMGTPVGDFVNSVLTPGGMSDLKLVEKFSDGGVDYGAIIQKIRELVAE